MYLYMQTSISQSTRSSRQRSLAASAAPMVSCCRSQGAGRGVPLQGRPDSGFPVACTVCGHGSRDPRVTGSPCLSVAANARLPRRNTVELRPGARRCAKVWISWHVADCGKYDARIPACETPANEWGQARLPPRVCGPHRRCRLTVLDMWRFGLPELPGYGLAFSVATRNNLVGS